MPSSINSRYYSQYYIVNIVNIQSILIVNIIYFYTKIQFARVNYKTELFWRKAYPWPARARYRAPLMFLHHFLWPLSTLDWWLFRPNFARFERPPPPCYYAFNEIGARRNFHGDVGKVYLLVKANCEECFLKLSYKCKKVNIEYLTISASISIFSYTSPIIYILI